MTEKETIQNGAFLIARKMFKSDLWINKPSSWKVIWIYILGNVAHKDDGTFKRGVGFFMFSRCLRDIGNDISIDMVKKSLAFFRRTQMIDTRRSTRGVYIRVLNYNVYQELDNYRSTDGSTKKALKEHQRSTPIHNNVTMKECKQDTSGANAPANTEIPELIKVFESINPACKRLYGSPAQRQACQDLIDAYSFERVKRVIESTLPKTNATEYFPSITTPVQLRDKWAILESKIKQNNSRQINNQPKVIFS